MSFNSPRDALDAGIATVYQDLAMIPLMSVTRNFFMGREPTKGIWPFRYVDFDIADEVTREEMKRIGIDVRDPNQAVGTLSGGERQCVAIARAVYFGAKVLILDEPTSALGVAQTSMVLKYIHQVRQKGLGVIFITHNVRHAYAVGDRFTVLNRGKTLGTYEKSGIQIDELQNLMAGGKELQSLSAELGGMVLMADATRHRPDRHRLHGQVPRAGMERGRVGLRRRGAAASRSPGREFAGIGRPQGARTGFCSRDRRLASLVSDRAVDVVSITTPNAFHPDMAIAALEAGKHVWCEKPMATKLADAERMVHAARASGKVAALGYNYIQNPMIRLIRKLLDAGRIGDVNHVRIEMDEDFMADPEALFYWKSEASSGHGALDDFGVHALSLLWILFGGVSRVCGHMSRPYADRPTAGGERRLVETFDIATTLIELENGASGMIALNRSAWGRKGRLFIQLFGARGTIVFDQERMNEVQLYTAEGGDTQGFRTILAGPQHPPYDKFIPAPGHGLGFNDLKIIECRELIARIRGDQAWLIDFEDGLRIEQTVDAMARSAHSGLWAEVG